MGSEFKSCGDEVHIADAGSPFGVYSLAPHGASNRWQLLAEFGFNLSGNLHVLFLCAVAAPQIAVMQPGPDRSRHIQPGLGVERQHGASTFLGHTGVQHLIVKIERIVEMIRDLVQEVGAQISREIINGVLTILIVLAPQIRQVQLGRLRITLRELLEGKGPVPKNLRGNRPGGGDLKAGAGLLKDAPMTMLDTVVEQSLDIRIVLIGRVGHPGAITDHTLSIGCDPDQMGLQGL